MNNMLKSEAESVDKVVTDATDAVQDLSVITAKENTNFYWISDSFNNNLFVDKSSTTILVDTDYGQVKLTPVTLEVINDFEISVDRENSRGIPGCNLLILNL